MSNSLTSLAEAAALIPDGASLSIGGFTVQRHPMALLYELIRLRRRDLYDDPWQLRRYHDSAVNDDAFQCYLDTYVYGVPNRLPAGRDRGRGDRVAHGRGAAHPAQRGGPRGDLPALMRSMGR